MTWGLGCLVDLFLSWCTWMANRQQPMLSLPFTTACCHINSSLWRPFSGLSGYWDLEEVCHLFFSPRNTLPKTLKTPLAVLSWSLGSCRPRTSENSRLGTAELRQPTIVKSAVMISFLQLQALSLKKDQRALQPTLGLIRQRSYYLALFVAWTTCELSSSNHMPHRSQTMHAAHMSNNPGKSESSLK